MMKKISFSFSKSSKQPIIINSKKPEERNDVELIDCLEGQSIKIKNAVEEEVKKPLVIPLRDDAKNLLDRVKQLRQTKSKNNDSTTDERPDSQLSLDELAARQLLKEATNHSIKETEAKVVEVPLSQNERVGGNESTIDDYESVPIDDYGLAMLRGMGWSASSGIGKQSQVVKTIDPELRPKGMGLGADKMLKAKVNLQRTNKQPDEELSLIKGAFVKVIAGAHNGKYCTVLSLDDENGRVIVKTAIEQKTLSLNEFLIVPVTKQEYNEKAKILNNAKYEEYKKRSEEQKSDIHLPSTSKGVKSSQQHWSGSYNREISKRRSSKEYSDDEEAFKHKKYKQESRDRYAYGHSSGSGKNSKRGSSMENSEDESASPHGKYKHRRHESHDGSKEKIKKYSSAHDDDKKSKYENKEFRRDKDDGSSKRNKHKKNKKNKKYRKESTSSEEENTSKRDRRVHKKRRHYSDDVSTDDDNLEKTYKRKQKKKHR